MVDAKIRTFLAVVETGSFTSAAERVYVTQPAVTQQIRRLEEHYGCRLIEHTGRSLRLTSKGELLYRYAQLQISNERQLQQRLSDAAAILQIGATLSIADYYLPPLLTGYLGDASRNIRLYVANTEQLTGKLLTGETACAFIEGNFDRQLFASRLFCTARFLPVVSSSHPLVGSRPGLGDMQAYPLLIREPGSGTRAILEHVLSEHNQSPAMFPKVTEIGNFKTIKRILHYSDAVSFMYEKVAEEEVRRGELAYLQPAAFDIERDMHFIYPRHSLDRDRYDAFFNQLTGGKISG